MPTPTMVRSKPEQRREPLTVDQRLISDIRKYPPKSSPYSGMVAEVVDDSQSHHVIYASYLDNVGREEEIQIQAPTLFNLYVKLKFDYNG